MHEFQNWSSTKFQVLFFLEIFVNEQIIKHLGFV
jgi:hypothetical protein